MYIHSYTAKQQHTKRRTLRMHGTKHTAQLPVAVHPAVCTAAAAAGSLQPAAFALLLPCAIPPLHPKPFPGNTAAW
jgi:hypothetical protein